MGCHISSCVWKGRWVYKVYAIYCMQGTVRLIYTWFLKCVLGDWINGSQFTPVSTMHHKGVQVSTSMSIQISLLPTSLFLIHPCHMTHYIYTDKDIWWNMMGDYILLVIYTCIQRCPLVSRSSKIGFKHSITVPCISIFPSSSFILMLHSAQSEQSTLTFIVLLDTQDITVII